MFALSLDNDSCRSPEGLIGLVPPAERPREKKLYLPDQKPLTHFQVCSKHAMIACFQWTWCRYMGSHACISLPGDIVGCL